MGYVNFLAAAYREKDAAGADEYQDSDSSQKTEGILASLLCGKCRVARKRGLGSRYDGGDYRSADGSGQLLQGVDHGISICIQFLGKLAQTVSHGIAYGTSLSQCKEDVKADTGKQFESACKQSKMKTILQPK